MNTTLAPIHTCQLKINCLKGGESTTITLTSANKKTAELLRLEFDILVDRLDLKPLLFITITFADPIPNRREREVSLIKFRKHFLEKQFAYGFTVMDRSLNGRPHFHLIAIGKTGADFHSGFDFKAYEAAAGAERRWRKSNFTDKKEEKNFLAETTQCRAAASIDLQTMWSLMNMAAQKYGLGRIDALPVKIPDACGKYLAKCITTSYRENNPDDRGSRRLRFWGKFPRKVSNKFYRMTKASKRWRGRLAFCAHVLNFDDIDDFAKCFGPHWYIFLKGIIRLVPIPIAEAALMSSNIPLRLIQNFRRELTNIEVELVDRLERYGWRS